MKQLVMLIVCVIVLLLLSSIPMHASAGFDPSPFEKVKSEKLRVDDVYYDNKARELVIKIRVNPSLIASSPNAGFVVHQYVWVDGILVEESTDWITIVKDQYEGSIGGAKPNGGVELTNRHGYVSNLPDSNHYHTVEVEFFTWHKHSQQSVVTSFSADVLFGEVITDDDDGDEKRP